MKIIKVLSLFLPFIFSIEKIYSQKMPDQNKWYYIVLEENKQCLMKTDPSVPFLVTDNKTSESDIFLWKFIRISGIGNLYMIVNKKNNDYIDIYGNSKSQGSPIIFHKNNGQTNQQFFLVPTPDSSFYIVSKSSGFVLTMKSKQESTYGIQARPVTSNGVKKGNWVGQFGLTGEKNQQWKFIEMMPEVDLKAVPK